MTDDSAPTPSASVWTLSFPMSGPSASASTSAGAPAAITGGGAAVLPKITVRDVDSVNTDYSVKNSHVVCKAVPGVGSVVELDCTTATTPPGFWQEYSVPVSILASFCVAVIGWTYSHWKDRKAATATREAETRRADREIYQRLELASADLFRWEAEHPQVIRHVWEASSDRPHEGSAEDVAVFHYLCQVLNLFEMAVEFRVQGVMRPDVFGSWISWFFEVGQAPGFPYYWERARLDYTPSLRAIMDRASELRGGDPEELKKVFFKAVGEQLKCPIVTGWLGLGTTRTPSNPTGLSFRWESDHRRLTELVQLFRNNVSAEYISHGEVIEERAEDFERWSQDLEAVLSKELKAALGSENGRLAVVEKDGRLLGFALIELAKRKKGDLAWLSDLVIDRSRRSAGIGEHLLKWVEKELSADGIQGLLLESGSRNERAHRFFERHGYRLVSKVMYKPLSGATKT